MTHTQTTRTAWLCDANERWSIFGDDAVWDAAASIDEHLEHLRFEDSAGAPVIHWGMLPADPRCVRVEDLDDGTLVSWSDGTPAVWIEVDWADADTRCPWRVAPRPWDTAAATEALAVVADWLADTGQHDELDALRAMAVTSPATQADRVSLGDLLAAVHAAGRVRTPSPETVRFAVVAAGGGRAVVDVGAHADGLAMTAVAGVERIDAVGRLT